MKTPLLDLNRNSKSDSNAWSGICDLLDAVSTIFELGLELLGALF